MGVLYDQIGKGYRDYRQPDPRIARALEEALAGVETVVNVGAGAGSYEPRDRRVVAVEPSRTMIDQRSPACAPVVQASADRLPFDDAAFDGSLGILTVQLLKGLLPFEPMAPAWVIAVGFLGSVVLGLLGGLYPAWRAASMDPVEAIRWE